LEHQRKVQEAIKAKARVPDEMEMKAIKTMGAMEEGAMPYLVRVLK
jgi:hypothetical protein